MLELWEMRSTPLFLFNMKNLLLIIRFHTVKCFQVLLFNTNNSIKHQSFVYTQLNDQIFLFQTI